MSKSLHIRRTTGDEDNTMDGVFSVVIIKDNFSSTSCRQVETYIQLSERSTVEPLLYDHPQNHIGVAV